MRSEKESSPTRHKKEHSVINALSLPFETMVVLRGQSELTVYGCKKILLYTTHEVRIKLTGEVICVSGEGLYCTAYHSGVVEIDGYITNVCFL